jgi:hypothetical protein
VPHYTVYISQHAVDDIMVIPPAVRAVHRGVMRCELRPWPRRTDPYEGSVSDADSEEIGQAWNDGLRWRRGGTDEIRRRLKAGGVVDAAIHSACEYVIIFEVQPPIPPRTDDNWQPRCTFRVIRILHNDRLARADIRLIAGSPKASRDKTS